MQTLNHNLRLRTPLLSLTFSIFLPFARSISHSAYASTTFIPPTHLHLSPAHDCAGTPAMMNAAAVSSSGLRRSPRSTRTSPYFSLQETRRSAASASGGDDVASVRGDGVTKKMIVKGSSDTKSEPANTSQTKKRSSPSPKKTKRKTKKSPSKNKAKKAKTKSSTSATTAVERTRSFEPVWWGNVLTADADLRHPHAAGIPTPAPSKAQKEPLPPVHTLILGTHPSIASLDKNQMYGHPMNAFWYIAGDALGFRRSAAISPKTGKPYVYFHDHLRHDNDKILEYPRQLEQMVRKGFAIWDIIAECEREGSLDTDIEMEVANPIRTFCEGELNDIGSENLSIKRIVIANGTTGAKFFMKHFSEWFVDGKLYAAPDEISQRALKTAMNKAKKANVSLEEDMRNGRLIEVVCLPSVSPAAAKFTYLEKRDAWDKGCYGPGLADYEEWNRSMKEAMKLTTPSKQTKPKSPRKSVTPSPKKPSIRLLSSDLAAIAPENEWVDLKVPAKELRPSATLTNGQCFNWLVVDVEQPAESDDSANSTPQKEQQQSAWGTHDAQEWVGPLQNRVISIRETRTSTEYRVLYGPTAEVKEDLQSYFRLETPLAPLYEEWSKADVRLAKIANAIPGVRILRQDPLECMFSFICSSNNNIPRIAKMLSSFRETYGTFMMELPTRQEGGDSGAVPIYSFPTLSSLADATEDELRGMGLGYRAKYIIETRDLLNKCGGNDFLLSLRTQQDAETVQEELIKFSGIGRKVADCIALFSLDSDDAIPVDVHVQHIASRDYDPTVLGEAKSLTPTIYKRVGDLFRDRFDSYPGWAHSLLFVAELPSFRGVLPADVVKEMDDWKEHEQMKKQEKKEESKKAAKTK